MDRISGNRTRITLPFGLVDRHGRRHRSVELVPINGRGELIGGDEPNPFRAAALLLANSLVRLGPYGPDEIDQLLLNGLIPLDRDFLMVQLNRLTFGDVQFHTVSCQDEACGERMDIQVDLSTAEPGRLPTGATLTLPIDNGRQVSLRLPTAGDQVVLAGLPPAAHELELLSRCLLPPSPDGPSLSREELTSLDGPTRSRIVEALLGASPDLDMVLELRCIKCARPFLFVYDPVRMLLALLNRSRRNLMKEIHYLAFYYHWSHQEILGLSRSLRREYLSLLEEELSSARDGGLAL